MVVRVTTLAGIVNIARVSRGANCKTLASTDGLNYDIHICSLYSGDIIIIKVVLVGLTSLLLLNSSSLIIKKLDKKTGCDCKITVT